jgi:sialic acid synthase SpsE
VLEVVIDKRVIGSNHPPLVLAEVGINHEGNFKKAIQCVDAAVAAGAECIKFQCHITEAEMVPTNMKPGKISRERLWDIIKRCELTEKEEVTIQKYCRKKNIMYLSTPFSREAADRLNQMGVPAFKIGSGECNNYPLIEHIARMGKPIILSTGMNNLTSIRKAVLIIKKYKCPLILTHCTSMYPTPYDKVRLGAIVDLQKAFSVPVGLSDHSIGIYTCLGATALGACVLEKHFTVSRKWPGPDISISIEPQELEELIKGSRAIWLASGGKKTILKEEMPVVNFAYASVVTIADIAKGEKLTEKNIWVKRPGTGKFPAEQLRSIIGKTATKKLKKEKQLSPNDIQ